MCPQVVPSWGKKNQYHKFVSLFSEPLLDIEGARRSEVPQYFVDSGEGSSYGPNRHSLGESVPDYGDPRYGGELSCYVEG